MDELRLILRYVHFIGWAALIGGALTQLPVPRRASSVVVNGTRIAFLSGVLLVAVKFAIAAQQGGAVNTPKFVLKTLLTVPVFAILEANRQRDLSRGAIWGILGVSALAMAVAVFWV